MRVQHTVVPAFIVISSHKIRGKDAKIAGWIQLHSMLRQLTHEAPAQGNIVQPAPEVCIENMPFALMCIGSSLDVFTGRKWPSFKHLPSTSAQKRLSYWTDGKTESDQISQVG